MRFRSPEKAVADTLSSDPDVQELLGGRVYPVLAPATAALPFATWRREQVQREMTLSGPMGLVTVVMALEIYAETYEQARELSDRVRRKLDGSQNEMASWTSVRNVSLINESDGFVTLAGGDLPPVYSVTMTFQILWGPEG